MANEWQMKILLVLLVIGCCDMVFARKPGKCPSKRREKICQDREAECLTDKDCAGLKKCCVTNCVKRCVAPIPKPYLKISQRTSLVTEGQFIIIGCHLEYQQFEGWYGPSGQRIMSQSENDNIYYHKDANRPQWFLSIKKVHVKDGGTYTCRGTMTKDKYKLHVRFTLENLVRKQFIEESKIGIIEVSVKGFPIPQYNWKKDGREIDPTIGRFSISPSGSLSIKDVTMINEGTYELTVRSDATKQAQLEYIQVFVISEDCPLQAENLITQRGCSSSIFDNCVNDIGCGHKYCCFDNCRRRCKGQLFDKPGKCPLLPIPRTCASSGVDLCQEDFDCLEKQKCCSNSCYKTCTHLTSSSTTNSGVTIYEPEDYIKSGSNVKRTCRVFNQPFEGWYNPNGFKIDSRSDRIHVRSHGPYHVLVIENVTAEDGGKYTCRGAIDSKLANIKINFTILEMPHFLMRVRARKHPILIKTFIRGHPLPKYIWYRNGKAIDTNSKKYTISPSGSLGIGKDQTATTGRYNLKIKQGGNVYDPDITVEVQSDEVSKDVVKRGTTVECLKREMRILIKMKLLEDMEANSLRLRDPSCQATSNGTHFLLVAPLMKCGTTVRHTSKAVVYSNAVLERETEEMITRLSDISVPFSCFYSKEGVSSTLGLLPVVVSKLLPGSNSSSKFDLSMKLYRDETFTHGFQESDFPLSIGLNKPLFIEVRVDSPDVRLAVLAERCYATPSQNPYDKTMYDVIRKGCSVDPTIKFYPSEPSKNRFSFNSFKFVDISQSYIFVHCKLVVCNATNPSSRCAHGCISAASLGKRQKRDLQEDYEFTQGPIILADEMKSESQQNEIEDIVYSSVYVLLSIAMGAICIVSLVTIVLLRKRLRIEKLSLAMATSKETQL